MECTAQAFEEMQEQNIRLLMQLKVVGVGRVRGEEVWSGEGRGGGVEEEGGRRRYGVGRVGRRCGGGGWRGGGVEEGGRRRCGGGWEEEVWRRRVEGGGVEWGE